jgi:muconolactone delta-isomerase
MKGVMAVFDLNSEDLVRLPYESPMFPFMDVEITPLVDMEVVRRVQAKK